MILNKSQPSKSLYVVGAKVIQQIKSTDSDFYAIDLFNALQEELNISFNQFLLTLDWLFLIGVIEHTDTGALRKCF